MAGRRMPLLLRGYERRDKAMPKIPDALAESVVYMFPDRKAAEDGERLGGTGFLVNVISESDRYPGRIHLYVVTANHVVDDAHPGIDSESTVVRVNTGKGDAVIIESLKADWILDPGNDLAVYTLPFPYEVPAWAHSVCAEDFIRKESCGPGRLGLGEDCFVLGRFVEQQGQAQNTPCARFGHIAMMPGAVEHDYGHAIESFMVDIRNIQPGYSGSPVFWYGPPRPNAADKRAVDPYLLGVCWGMHPRHDYLLDAITGEVIKGLRVLRTSGTMTVTPAWKLIDILVRPEVVAERKVREKKWDAGGGATAC